MAYIDKLADNDNCINYLHVVVDVLSRKLRVQPMRTKVAEETDKNLGPMITKTKPLEVWSDKKTEFNIAFKKLCETKGIDTNNRNSEANSTFAERNNRSLENIIYKHSKNKWSEAYINEM